MEFSRQAYQTLLERPGKHSGCTITTEILAASSFQTSPGDVFYVAEEEHQQFLAKPGGGEVRRKVLGSLHPLGISMRGLGDLAPAKRTSPKPKLSEEFWRRHAPAAASKTSRASSTRMSEMYDVLELRRRLFKIRVHTSRFSFLAWAWTKRARRDFVDSCIETLAWPRWPVS